MDWEKRRNPLRRHTLGSEKPSPTFKKMKACPLQPQRIGRTDAARTQKVPDLFDGDAGAGPRRGSFPSHKSGAEAGLRPVCEWRRAVARPRPVVRASPPFQPVPRGFGGSRNRRFRLKSLGTLFRKLRQEAEFQLWKVRFSNTSERLRRSGWTRRNSETPVGKRSKRPDMNRFVNYSFDLRSGEKDGVTSLLN
jgi:hypothetical protein